MSVLRVGFLVLPQASLLSLGGAIDALAQANERLVGSAFEAVVLSGDGQPVRCAGGATITVEAGVREAGRLDALFVVADTPLPEQGHDDALLVLQGLAAEGRLLGGIGTGAWLLARAGLLRGYRATLHWPYAMLFAERFADTVVSGHLHEIDRDRLTCAGGTASFDMLLTWLHERHGEALTQSLIDHYGIERPRGRLEQQRVPLAARIGGGQPKLAEAVTLMEANLGEPLATEDIARLVGVSRRQLERLFKQHLDALPSRYYLDLRLARARRLLQQSSQSILQIGLSCGFSSGPHFSSAYRHHFGVTPREQRSPRVAQTLHHEGHRP